MTEIQQELFSVTQKAEMSINHLNGTFNPQCEFLTFVLTLSIAGRR